MRTDNLDHPLRQTHVSRYLCSEDLGGANSGESVRQRDLIEQLSQVDMAIYITKPIMQKSFQFFGLSVIKSPLSFVFEQSLTLES